MKMLRCVSLPSVCLLVAGFAADARADTIRPSADTSSAITGVAPGVMELGFETNFNVGYDKLEDTSSLRIAGVFGPTFRYFLANNLSLAVNGSFLYRRSDGLGTESAIGGLGSVGVDYHFPVGGGLFFYPGIAAGGFYAKRDIYPIADDDAAFIRSSIYGGLAKAGLGLIFYPSRHFNLFARPEALVLVGKNGDVQVSTVDPALAPEGTFISLDASFAVGMSYVF